MQEIFISPTAISGLNNFMKSVEETTHVHVFFFFLWWFGSFGGFFLDLNWFGLFLFGGDWCLSRS